MDDELKRKIAASLDLPADTPADPDVVEALENDPRALAYYQGLRSIEDALRRWPTPSRSAADWERFATMLEQRLGEAPWESSPGGAILLSWDPLDRPPLRETTDEVNHSEHKSMAQSHDDKETDDDLEGLAALVRTSSSTAGPSIPPPASVRPGPSLSDDAMDESSGIVDIKHLAEVARRQSVAPPAAPPSTQESAPAVAAAPAAAAAVPAPTAAAEEKPAAKARSEAPAAPAPAAVAVPVAEKKKSSAALWLLPLVAAAGAGIFFVARGNQQPSTSAPATAHTASEARSEALAATHSAPAAPAIAQAESTPAAQPAAPAEPPAPPAAAAPAAAPTEAPVAAPAQPPAPAVAARTAAPAHASAEEAPARRAAEREPESTASARTAATTRTAAPGAGASAQATTTVAATAPTPAPAHTAPAAASAGGAATGASAPRSIDELMAAATGGSRAGAAPAAPAQSQTAELPDRPSRAQVTQTLSPLQSAVRACTQGQTGIATVAMVISSDGTVQSASVSGPFDGSVNNCIAGVVRRAHFPPFRRPSVPIVYPFSIQPPRPGQ